MKIIELRAKNVKRIRAIEIKPDGNVVVIAGKNGQGKTSILDSIAMALGGKAEMQRQPVRRGQPQAEVVCDLGDIVVRRTWTPDGGGTLNVRNKDGSKFTSPQGLLDSLVGRLSFDPLAFSRMAPRDQAETLQKLVGLDFGTMTAERGLAFAERTAVNRDLKAEKARLDAMPARHLNVPETEQSAGEVLKDIDALTGRNNQRQSTRAKATTAEQDLRRAKEVYDSWLNQISRTEAEIHRLQVQLQGQKEEAEKQRLSVGGLQDAAIKAKSKAATMIDEDVAPLRQKLANIETVNRQVRENAARAVSEQLLSRKAAASEALTERIAEIDAAKQSAIEAAKFPVAGLGFDADGVTLNGLPFEQASAAEQLRVSVAMGLAANPKLRVLLIRDGSLLDQDSLRVIGEMAEASDAQVWIERVEQDGNVGVLIEDGLVVTGAEQAHESNGKAAAS